MIDSIPRRWRQLVVLILAAGAIYPLLYLRQNFEGAMLEAFRIGPAQLGRCYGMLGVLFLVSYLPSGWLADRIQPRLLLTISLLGTGLLGLWYWTLPSFPALLAIFAGWGITTGLTFWAALIKQTNLIASSREQGRFFGLLEGGRGLFEALLGTLAVALFAWSLSTLEQGTVGALRQVILMYVAALFLIAVLVWFAVDGADEPHAGVPDARATRVDHWGDLRRLLGNPDIWLAAVCIHCGYALYYIGNAFSGYLQAGLGFSAVTAGWITVGRLWMRPLGGVLGGMLADRFGTEQLLAVAFIGCTLGLWVLALLPTTVTVGFVLGVVLFTALASFVIRGVYWATLEDCGVPVRVRGLAVGWISAIGYSAEVWVPVWTGSLLERTPGRAGFEVLFASIGVLGLIGAAAALSMGRLGDSRAPVADA